MADIGILKQKVIAEIEAKAEYLWQTALDIHSHPELGLEEHHAAEVLSRALSDGGFTITSGPAGLDTAFIAHIDGSKPKPMVALLCEYDALPELGHACGHNLIGTASVGAGLGLAAVADQLPGSVTVIGAPGEETHSGKAKLVDAGAFANIDAAMMFHPAAVTRVSSTSYALDALEFVFRGRPAHAAASPEMGINALDGAIHLFNGVNALREHLPDDVRIHGIISEGGAAPNIVPERAAARFYVRAPHRRLLDEVVGKVKRCAQGAAMMAGASLEWNHFEPSNDNLVSNAVLSDAFAANLRSLGVLDIAPPAESKGSTDMGNVSHVVPSIHPYISLGIDTLVGHTSEFAAACAGTPGRKTMLLAAKALATTTVDFLCQKPLQQMVQAEFTANLG